MNPAPQRVMVGQYEKMIIFEDYLSREIIAVDDNLSKTVELSRRLNAVAEGSLIITAGLIFHKCRSKQNFIRY